MTASLAGWVEPVGSYEYDIIPLALILHLTIELAKALLLNRFCKVSVFHHAFYIQIFHDHSTWFSCYD